MTRKVEGYELLNANIKTNMGVKDMDDLTFPLTNTAGAGTVAAVTVSAAEYGDGVFHQTVLTLTAAPVTMRDTEQGGGLKIYTFPKGRILFLGGSGQITTTTTSAIATTLLTGKTCNWGIGTTTQANGTLATTEQDLLQVAAWVSSTVINVAPAISTAGKGSAILAPYAGISTATAAFLNLAVAAAGDIDGNATTITTGTITLTWANLGLL